MASNSVVAHNWAHQTRKSAKGSNFFYEGQNLYSYGYHFVVGAITDDGKTAVLNNGTYSNSTHRHQSYARTAVSHLNRVYCAEPGSAIRGYHDNNLKVWKRQVDELMNKDVTRCKLHKLVVELERVLASSRAYCNYFKLPPSDYEIKATAFINELMASAKWLREQELEATMEVRRAAAEAKRLVENLADFRAGKVRYFSSPTQYLRLNGENVCTSLGVCIKVREFMLHYNRLVRRENLVGTKITGDYTILSVTEASVKIGCHVIGRDELDSIAQQIKIHEETF